MRARDWDTVSITVCPLWISPMDLWAELHSPWDTSPGPAQPLLGITPQDPRDPPLHFQRSVAALWATGKKYCWLNKSPPPSVGRCCGDKHSRRPHTERESSTGSGRRTKPNHGGLHREPEPTAHSSAFCTLMKTPEKTNSDALCFTLCALGSLVAGGKPTRKVWRRVLWNCV